MLLLSFSYFNATSLGRINGTNAEIEKERGGLGARKRQGNGGQKEWIEKVLLRIKGQLCREREKS